MRGGKVGNETSNKTKSKDRSIVCILIIDLLS